MIIDPVLRTWATKRQAEYMDAVEKYGGIHKAEKALGLSNDTLCKSIRALKRRAALHGYSPEHDMQKTTPSPYVVKGVSSYYDSNGELRGQWVKTTLDDQNKVEVIKDFIESLSTDIIGLSPRVAPPKRVLSDLLTVYPMGDPHFGLYAWAEEAGEDFDLKIAEQLTKDAIDRLVDSAPASDTAIILPLGDLLHSDNVSNQTVRSGNALDVDTRWARVMVVTLRSLIYSILAALRKHKKVVVRVVAGNHDPHSSIAIAIAIACYFQNESRVEVDLSPCAFWYYKFGKVLIGSTHGDTCKMTELPGVMACDRPKEWGDTKHRHWYVGHIHHKQLIQEYPGCNVESFRTLAARDAWHNASGYRAGRDMCAIVHHKEHGEIERHRCDVGMLDV